MINRTAKKQITLVIASGNVGKVKEFRELLTGLPCKVVPMPNGFKVEENGDTFVENARLKASAVSKATGCLALADDSGLSVEALNGEPGIHSARYANSDEERIKKLIRELGYSANRNAKFVASICVASPKDILLEVEGFCSGKITKHPRGTNGFGYDPIFEVGGTDLTFAQMDLALKRSFSHRGKAFKLLRPLLLELINKDYKDTY